MKRARLSLAAASCIVVAACSSGSNSGEPGGGENTPPVLSLVGDDSILLELGSTYEDEGAEAIDAEDGDISASIVTVGAVDTSVEGIYTIAYNVSDSEGLPATEVVRTLQVVTPLTLTVDTSFPLEVVEVEDPLGGPLRPVGAVSGFGSTAHLVENEILIATDDTTVIDDFLGRWPAVLLETVELEGTPNMHTLSVDPTAVTLDDLAEHIGAISELSFGEIALFIGECTKTLCDSRSGNRAQ